MVIWLAVPENRLAVPYRKRQYILGGGEKVGGGEVAQNGGVSRKRVAGNAERAGTGDVRGSRRQNCAERS